jgi:hypothetical protein
MTVIGWIMLVWFLPTGMWAYCFDNIMAFVKRPIPMDPAKFKKAKEGLAKLIAQLMKIGEELVEQKKQHLESEEKKKNFFSKFFDGRKIQGDQNKFERDCELAEIEFKKLDQIAAYNLNVEPCKFVLWLVIGILFGIFSLVMMIHIFCNVAVFQANNVPSDPFLNTMFFKLEDSMLSVVTIPTMILCGYYFLLAAFKGNVKLGMRFLFVTFYPIQPKETFVNSFFINAIVLNLYSVAVT